MRRLWGVMTLKDARRYGYHVPPEFGGRKTPAPERDSGAGPRTGVGRSMTDMTRRVLYGSVKPKPPGANPRKPHRVHGKVVPEGGCFGKARRMLDKQLAEGEYFDPDKWANIVLYTAHKRTKKDPAVQAVFADWSECMKRKGYNYTTPLEAVGDPRWGDLLDDTSSPKEINTAIADMKCKKQTNLIETTFRVESSYQRNLIQKYQTQLTRSRKRWEAIVHSAAEVLDVPVPD